MPKNEDKALSLNIDELISEYNRMNSEIEEIDTLYTSSKELLESNTKGSRANYVFVANQTSNLISIKNHKLNLLKSMNDIKKSIIDLKIKEYNFSLKNGDISDNTKEIVDQLFKKLMNLDTNEIIQASIEEHINDNDRLSEEDIDKLLEERIHNDKKKEEKPVKKETKKFNIVINNSDNVPYIIDKDYNIIEDDDSEEFKEIFRKSENIVILNKKDNENGDTIAIDSDGNEYEIVELE